MAFSVARKELDCSVCLNIYTDPVTLKCGHNFCRDCIGRVLDTQDESGVYCCPECREEFQERPELPRNTTLRNIVENLRSAEPEKKESQIFCTYCFHSPVPAVKSCLLCEASLCDNHLKVPCKSPEHVLSEITTSLDIRKCSVHEKILEYYCTEDSACLCGSCRLHGEHEDHQVETLEEASEDRKENLTYVLQTLLEKREEMEQSIKSLKTYQRKIQSSATGVTKSITTIFRDIRRQLDTLERKVRIDITRQAEKDSLPASDLIQELEMKKDKLSRKMRHIEEICNMADPLTFLQESDNEDLCDTEDRDNEDKARLDRLLRGGRDLDVSGLSHTLFVGLSRIISRVNVGIYISEPAYISLDEDTAHNRLHISDDKKTARKLDRSLDRPTTPMRFQGKTRDSKSIPQVLSIQSFSSGRHYWDVDVGGSSCWTVGVCYPSVDRKSHSIIGDNYKSWCLEGTSDQISVRSTFKSVPLLGHPLVTRVRISLDYEAGQISFYDLRIPIQHIHTYTMTSTPTHTFTEPLHAVLYVGEGCIKICTRNQEAM